MISTSEWLAEHPFAGQNTIVEIIIEIIEKLDFVKDPFCAPLKVAPLAVAPLTPPSYGPGFLRHLLYILMQHPNAGQSLQQPPAVILVFHNFGLHRSCKRQ